MSTTTIDMKAKEKVDKVAQRLYDKDWESLIQPQSKYRVMAVALEESEQEIEKLKNEQVELVNLLKYARCPDVNCNNGVIPNQISQDEWVPEQCQWDYERNKLIQQFKEQKK